MATSWDHYRSFLAVLSEGSLSAAARRLRLTQPTLGRHIDELEQSLGVALFSRSQAGLTPTEAAIELRPYAETMAGAAEALVRAASGEAGEERGVVRLTASEVVATEVLPSILAEFHQVHPRIAIELVSTNRNEDLLHRRADIAVRMMRPTQSALVARRIGAAEIGLYAHQRYIDRHGVLANLDEPGGHTLIGYDQETAAIQVFKKLGLNLVRETFALRTDSDVVQLAAVRAGFGIGVCQVPIAKRNPELVRLVPDAFSFALDFWLVMHEDIAQVRRVRLLYDHLGARLADYIAMRTPA